VQKFSAEASAPLPRTELWLTDYYQCLCQLVKIQQFEEYLPACTDTVLRGGESYYKLERDSR
jgi:hypothetical protein